MEQHMTMTPRRWDEINRYLHDVFGRVNGEGGDPQLADITVRALARGLPTPTVSADVGRLLLVLSLTATRGPDAAGRIIEVGTLFGHSGIWLARGLPDGGTLHTIEIEDLHADFAATEFAAAGVASKVRQERGPALEVLERLARTLGPTSVDMVFFDAVKTEYTAYLELCSPLIRPGGFLIADNALMADWWIDDPPGSHPGRDAMDAFNRRIAADPEFDAACVPARAGVIIARKRT